MRKNIFIVLLFVCFFALIGCEHQHEYVEKTVESTCTEKGYTEFTCECGHSYKDNYVEELGHSFGEWVTVKEATLEEAGLRERECSCGFKETEEIEKLAHTHEYGEWVTVKEATEEEEGIKERTCSCGEKETGKIEKLPHTHKYGEWVTVKEATEEEEGIKERTCSCGEKETEFIEKLEHVHDYSTIVYEPTCTSKGYTEYICDCGDIYEDDFVDELPHEFSAWWTSKKPTDEEEGLKERYCECGLREYETIPKLEHTHKYGDWNIITEPTEESEGLKERSCKCGLKETEVMPKLEHTHKYGDWKILKDATELEEGLKERTCPCGEVQTVKIPKIGDYAIVYVGVGEDYETLDQALTECEDKTIIILKAGEYTLSVPIDKNVKIYGPNVNLQAPADANPEALINVAKDKAGNLSGKNIEFNGVHLKGTGGGAGVPGITFQDGGNIEKLVFKSCEISDTNTFIKFVDGASNLELTIKDCKIHTIGQFIIWTTKAINKTNLIGNIIEGATCGAVTNANAALFRIRFGALEAYNNVFNGDSLNEPGYFECSALDSVVKFNVFNNVTRYTFKSATNKVVFDQNVYLNEGGKVLDKAPSNVGLNGATADKKVLKSVDEIKNEYLNYLLTQFPDRYFKVEFDANGGEITSVYPTVYDKEEGIDNLPTVELDGYIFAGWYLNDEMITAVKAGTSGNITIKAKWNEDCLLVDGTNEEGHYATIADALAAAKEGDVIKLVAGEYNENVTISVPNLIIKGPNAGINAVNGNREAEAIIKGVFTVTSKAYGLTIDGLSFTGNAKVKYDESVNYNGFKFQNNKVYDTTEATKQWDESRYTLPGFIQFTMTSGGVFRNVEIYNNSFVNVSEVNVLANRVSNLVVDGNLFKDFDLDAIRTEGGYCYGALAFTNNTFEQSVSENGNGAIFLYSLAGPSDAEKAVVLIKNNKFINIGKNNGTVFTGAINAYRFQEKYTSISIENNIFDKCYDYIYLRNNGGNSSNWSCVVENNQFIGLPHNQYFGTYRGTDTEATNPHLAIFTKNYYEDNDGKVITDLNTVSQYFKHLSSKGEALQTKPESIEVKPVELWKITYELNDGTTNGTFVYEYNSLIKDIINLPVLTKPNHVFNGWLLNGELVTEITVDYEGDLNLIADFTLLEGEVYNIEFIPNKENVIWPSRGAADREEIISELFKDMYEWAKSNGESKAYDAYVTYIKEQLAAYSDIFLRNPSLGNYPAEDGSTTYFFNVPKYYQKWKAFFEVFNTAMLAVNSDQNFYKDTYATMVRMHQFITWTTTGQGYFNSYLSKMCAATKVLSEIPESYRGGQVLVLPQLSLANGLKFIGWYDNPEFTGDVITEITAIDSGDKKYYGKWEEEQKVENISINSITELLLFTEHQLVWNLTPANATNKEVEFFSSNEKVATVTTKGLIKALAKGTTTITVRVYGNRELDMSFTVNVFTNDTIEGSYETASYVNVGSSITLNAKVNYKNNTTGAVKWASLNQDIATVDANGIVSAVKPGIATIVATAENNENLKLEFTVTVLDDTDFEVMEFLLANHESNIFTKYNLGIGSGTPAYYMDIFGSVNKVLANESLKIDESLKNKEVENNTGDYFNEMKSVEFITVHYTGNMASGANSKANANYFVGDNAVSIHYTTGNDGIYQCLTHDKGGYHAGDSGAADVVGLFEWIPSGVKVQPNDPLYPEFTISTDFYYEINGQKTSIPMPKPWNYSSRGTDHTLNADGTISSKSSFGQSGFSNRLPESFINDQSLPFKIVGDEYYMGTTWWCYTQVYEGRICSTGGNRNSIGIESCVNQGSDLWYTWQLTAKLVAKLMVDYNLDITKVRGHHFFTAKDCPQPMLENDLEIWWEFLELVEAEYDLLTKYSDYEIKFESHNPEILDNNGRIIKQPAETTCVSYTITITKDGKSESVTLSSIINGLYVNR